MHDISTVRRASWRRAAAVLTALVLGVATVPGPATAAPVDAFVQHRGSHGHGHGHGGGMRMWDDGVTWNVSHVTNGGRGRERSKVRSALVRTDSKRVHAANIARARASCKDCRTVAVAFEVVLADRRPIEMTFHNEAVAENRRCVRCETVAMAYQIAVVAPGIRLTRDGVHDLRDIHAEMREVASSEDLSVEEVTQQVDALVAEAMAVLDEELYQKQAITPAGPSMSTLSAEPANGPEITLRADVDRG
jgi:putative peptide zinc metalloprotease protein